MKAASEEAETPPSLYVSRRTLQRPPFVTPKKRQNAGGVLHNPRQKQLTGSPSLSRLSKKYFTDSPCDRTARVSVILQV